MKAQPILPIITLLTLLSLSIQAQDSISVEKKDNSLYKWERFSVNLGGFLTSMNSDISLSGHELGLGVNINLEEALGLQTTTTVVRSDINYFFGKRNRSGLSLEYFRLFRNSRKTLESEIEIGNSVFPIGTEITSKLNLEIIKILYDYAFFKDERLKLAFSGGFYILPISFALDDANQIISESATFIAPLPVLGLKNTVFITPKFLIKQNFEVLYIKTSGFKGSISDINIWLEYNPFKHFGFGIGYNALRINVSAYKSVGVFENFEGNIRSGVTGLLFYGKYFF